MVRNNTQLENSIIFIDQKLNRLLRTRKVIEGILNDLNNNQRGPVSSSDTAHKPAPSQFSPLQAKRGLGDLPPLCLFGQGDYARRFTPAGDKGIITKFGRLLRRLWQAVLSQIFRPASHVLKDGISSNSHAESTAERSGAGLLKNKHWPEGRTPVEEGSQSVVEHSQGNPGALGIRRDSRRDGIKK